MALTTASPLPAGVPRPPLPATAKPQPRRPTLVRKRDDDAAESAAPASPSKKARVAFNNDVEVKVLEPWGGAPAQVRDEVRRALERHARGERWEYESLKDVYAASDEPVAAAALRSYTAAIAGHAARLGRAHRGLVTAMLHSDWITGDASYFALFQRFLSNLASTQGIWLADILGYLVDVFKQCMLIPAASSTLAGVLSRAYPGPSDSRRRHVVYVRNLWRITQYAPELRAEVLSLVTSELVKIDVQVQINLLDLADDAGDGLVKQLAPPTGSSLDDATDDDAESEAEDEPDEAEELDLEAERAKQILSHIEKLDAIMDILFEVYTRLAQAPGGAPYVADTLLAQFNAHILPSYRSRHTQFLLFHFAQRDPDTLDLLVGALTATVFDAARPPLVRESAAAYLASLVARGRGVPGATVRDVFAYLGAQLAGLRALHLAGNAGRGPDPRRYRVYYALVQALLYVFCFRWRDLTVRAAAAQDRAAVLSPASSSAAAGTNTTTAPEDPDDDDDDELDVAAPAFVRAARDALRDNIFAPLNPLRVCAPAIVAEFARVARRLGFLYVYPLLERNRRVHLPAATPASGGLRDTALSAARGDPDAQRLDAYFPFDPYRLPRSRRWVEADYREWVGVPGDSDRERAGGGDDDDGASSEEEDGDSDED